MVEPIKEGLRLTLEAPIAAREAIFNALYCGASVTVSDGVRRFSGRIYGTGPLWDPGAASRGQVRFELVDFVNGGLGFAPSSQIGSDVVFVSGCGRGGRFGARVAKVSGGYADDQSGRLVKLAMHRLGGDVAALANAAGGRAPVLEVGRFAMVAHAAIVALVDACRGREIRDEGRSESAARWSEYALAPWPEYPE